MPVLESTDNITPRSVLRHRPIGDDKQQPSKRTPAAPSAKTPVVQRASRPRPRPAETGEDNDIAEWQRVEEDDDDQDDIQQAAQPVRRTTGQARGSSKGTQTQQIPQAPRTPLPRMLAKRRAISLRAHPLLYLGAGMLLMVLLWVLLSSFIGWFSTTMDNIHYGYPRTYQTDAFVGHNEQNGVPSHFIAINLHGHIEVIEMPGGDASHARIYLGPQLYGNGADLVPVTLKFVDVNGDHLPDMVVMFQDSQVVFINTQSGFRSLNPNEHYTIP